MLQSIKAPQVNCETYKLVNWSTGLGCFLGVYLEGEGGTERPQQNPDVSTDFQLSIM